jgi:hypothetical protein
MLGLINQLKLNQEFLAYRKVDKELADVSIAKVQKHLYYTAENMVVHGLVSKALQSFQGWPAVSFYPFGPMLYA